MLFKALLADMHGTSLTRFAWLSIAAAILTIGLKTTAWWITGSVGLLSDAMESVVNLVGGLMALAMLTVAERPADDDHPYGHGKAEYFSSGVEGTLILIAALSIGVAAVDRIISPKPLAEIGIGLAVSVAASLVNLGVALLLLRVGRKRNSITLEANARHLLTEQTAGADPGPRSVNLDLSGLFKHPLKTVPEKTSTEQQRVRATQASGNSSRRPWST